MKISNLRGHGCWSELRDCIQEVSHNEEIYFVPAAGNYGDALINIGSRQFFDFYNIKYIELNRKEVIASTDSVPDKKKLVVLGGGGAYCKNFSSTFHLAKNMSDKGFTLLILPSTYELPKIESSKVFYFSRDKFNSLEAIPEAIFCHDMAFFIDIDIPTIDPEDKLWRLFSMRADKEGHKYNEMFAANFDVSRIGDANYTNPRPFFNLINNFKLVNTDRMHIAIAASMLGLRCNLIPGNYFKSKAVFESSIRDAYPKTKLTVINDI